MVGETHLEPYPSGVVHHRMMATTGLRQEPGMRKSILLPSFYAVHNIRCLGLSLIEVAGSDALVFR